MKAKLLTPILLLLSLALSAQTASVQIIHNSPSPTVDIYANGTKLISDFEFRTATPFVDVPSGVDIDLAVAPSPSNSAAEAVATFTVNLADGEKYVAIATGIVGDMDTPFDLKVITPAQEMASDPANVDFAIYHGSTDAPAVDIIARDVATLADDAEYGDNTNYLSVPAADYIIDITPADNNDIIVASYTAPLSALEGGAAVVFASGFLAPPNMDDPAFGIFAALPNGDVLELPAIQNTARLQVIHNSPNPVVDVWVNGAKLLDSFEYRTATPFIDVSAGTPLNIGVAPHPSTSTNDIVADFDVILTPDQKYVAIATGIVGDMDTPFDLKVITPAQEMASDPANVDFAIYHGSTDAPAVDIIARDVATLGDDAEYGDNTNYLSVPAADYIIDITPADDNTNILFSYDADLTTLAGGAGVVYASGFVNPMGADDPDFGIFLTLPDGTTVEIPRATTNTQNITDSDVSIFPTLISNGVLNMVINDVDGEFTWTVHNLYGQVIKGGQLIVDNQQMVSLNVDDLNQGAYVLQVKVGEDQISKVFVVQ